MGELGSLGVRDDFRAKKQLLHVWKLGNRYVEGVQDPGRAFIATGRMSRSAAREVSSIPLKAILDARVLEEVMANGTCMARECVVARHRRARQGWPHCPDGKG